MTAFALPSAPTRLLNDYVVQAFVDVEGVSIGIHATSLSCRVKFHWLNMLAQTILDSWPFVQTIAPLDAGTPPRVRTDDRIVVSAFRDDRAV
jgi:hypothetical protein